ncbi:extracellular solute-binding protein [Allostreptomyces psammosilenae]|uniref:Multiple sugar transport system substrate-binding protein n=1 Tax=Allostreptomyces psammosilenae TaxID=1892865 RepID=A0A852ZM94_9ACTN|nr:extracellular solute-binding protein [Allostreptomyces psammosilenae]NYI03523.1 multiple sugar transport system substrate-binding protein [Allostreptomyces psammosilenae]
MKHTAGPTRRGFLAAGLGLGAAAALAGCGTPVTALGAGPSLQFWNLFAGGDGVRLQDMLNAYRQAHPGVTLEDATLTWGAPYYTKLAMSAAGGRSPDVAVLHLSRLTAFSPGRLLDPFDTDLLAEAGLTEADFPADLWQRGSRDGRLYAVPLDSHPLVNYYNTEICGQAGLLDTDGKLLPLESPEALIDALERTREITGTVGLTTDMLAPYRVWWSFFRQMDGTLELPEGGTCRIDEDTAIAALEYIRDLGERGLVNPAMDMDGAIAMFSSGQAAFHWNGEWEVSTFLNGQTPFSMDRFPGVFGNYRVRSDSHALVLPHQRDRDPSTTRDTYEFIAFLLKQSLTWAEGGHIPAYRPVAESADYLALDPQSNYRSAIDSAELDPQAWFSGSGADLDSQANAAFSAVVAGRATPQDGLRQFVDAMNRLLATPSPV